MPDMLTLRVCLLGEMRNLARRGAMLAVRLNDAGVDTNLFAEGIRLVEEGVRGSLHGGVSDKAAERFTEWQRQIEQWMFHALLSPALNDRTKTDLVIWGRDAGNQVTVATQIGQELVRAGTETAVEE